jgi:hypothetical protein
MENFKMRRNGGELLRATENTEEHNISTNSAKTMAAYGMTDSGMNYGEPINAGTPKKDPKKNKKEDNFDFTPSTPGAGVTGTMVTENVGKGTLKPIYEKGKEGGGFEPKKAGDKLAGGGKVVSTSKDGKKQKVRTVKFS